MTLVELLTAMAVLAIGLAGIMALVLAALASNSRNQSDTSATLLSQMVIEQMANIPVSTSPVIVIRDCAGTAWNINTAAAAGPAGAGAPLHLNDTPPAWVSTDIDFTQAWGSGAAPPVAAPGNGYSMLYASCGPNGLPGKTYDVRWNIQTSNIVGGVSLTKTVYVAARARGTGGNNSVFFSFPVQLKSILGN